MSKSMNAVHKASFNEKNDARLRRPYSNWVANEGELATECISEASFNATGVAAVSNSIK